MRKWSQSKLSLNIIRGKNDKTAAVLLLAHHEKAGFSGKDHNAGKNQKQQEKRKTGYEMN